VDAQILARWQALRTDPDLDAHQALRTIDELLDRRARLTAGALDSEPAIRLAILADIIGMLL
jgi:hypothetical protein